MYFVFLSFLPHPADSRKENWITYKVD